jgi:hypothetical protein
MTEPHEGIDPFRNPEAETEQRAQTPQVERGGVSGTVATGPAPGPEQPDQAVDGGVADGNPVAGVGVSDSDRDDAVKPSMGPEYPPSSGGHA